MLMCGDLSVSWEVLMQGIEIGFAQRLDCSKEVSGVYNLAILTADASNNTREPEMTHLSKISKLRAAFVASDASKRPLLFDMVVDFSDSRCADSRDKVYGFLALAQDGEHFPVDYTTRLFGLIVTLISYHSLECFNQRLSWHDQSLPPIGHEVEPLRDGRQLLRILRPNNRDIMQSLHDTTSDRIVIPVQRSAAFLKSVPFGRMDKDCELTPEAAKRACHIYSGSEITLAVLGCGRVVAASMMLSFEEPHGADWRGHIWVCGISSAIHISRALYVYALGYIDIVNQPGSPLQSWEHRHRGRKPAPGRASARSCGCNEDNAIPRTSPLSRHVHDGECTGAVNVDICGTHAAS
jgi:hypothetical protein